MSFPSLRIHQNRCRPGKGNTEGRGKGGSWGNSALAVGDRRPCPPPHQPNISENTIKIAIKILRVHSYT